LGNRKSLTVPNGSADTYTYDARNRVSTHAAANAGNTIYSSVFRYDQGVSFQEIDAGVTTVEFVRGSGMGGGIGSILYSDRSTSGGVVEYFHYSAVGHTVATSNAAGAVQSSNLYEAYGNIVFSTGSSRGMKQPYVRLT
jgi:hypothetical protein